MVRKVTRHPDDPRMVVAEATPESIAIQREAFLRAHAESRIASAHRVRALAIEQLVAAKAKAAAARAGRAKGIEPARRARAVRLNQANAEFRKQALRMRGRGLSNTAIAQHLKISRGRVARLFA